MREWMTIECMLCIDVEKEALTAPIISNPQLADYAAIRATYCLSNGSTSRNLAYYYILPKEIANLHLPS